MTVKADPSGRRSITVEIEVPGTPEEVWEAIATGPGISCWFFPTEIEPRVGGAMTQDTRPFESEPAEVTVWDPPRRFAYRGKDAGADAPPTAAEWTVTARSGSRSVVRVVHSIFADRDDWDDQLESFEAGWPQCFEILRLYLTHFAGQPVALIRTLVTASGSADEAFAALLGALRLTEVAAGGRWSGAGPDGPDAAGLLEGIHPGPQPFAVVRLDDPAPGIAAASTFQVGGPAMATLWAYLYGDRAAAVAARDEPRWQAWMEAHFA